MFDIKKLRQSRKKLLDHISLIEEMRRGSVTRQFLKIKKMGEPEPVLVGPYALFTFKKKGRTISRRLHDIEEIRTLERQVENGHIFRKLCTQLMEISEQICEEKEKARKR